MIRRLRAAALLAAAVVLCAACPGPPAIDRIVLVTLDTTRADHLGCYGYAAAATPSLDRLAREGALFTEASTPVPVTLPAHASLFTGKVPPQHGVRYNGTFRLEPSARTLAEVLLEKGWATGAITASFAVAKRFGLDQGFDEYDDMFAGDSGAKLSATAERRAEEVARLGLSWLDRHPGGRSFLWLHFYDPHADYEPPFPFSQSFRERPYDGEIAYVDQELGRILDRLRADPVRWKSTLVVVAADHGEGLYDHGEKTHGTLLYQSTVHVPLLIKLPGAPRSRSVREPVSLVDVFPTLLDYLGLPAEPDLVGRSLRPLLESDARDLRPQYFEALTGSLNFGWSSLQGIRRGSWKLIAGVDPELFDLAADPKETRNLLAAETIRGTEMQQEVDELLAAWASSAGPAVPVQLDPEAQERLESLGYIGVGGGSARRDGPDPKRLIALEPDLLGAQQAVTDRRWSEVESTCAFVLEKDPTNRLALFYLARARLELGRPRDAIQPAETLAKRYPDFEDGHDLLGRVWRAAAEPERAVTAFEAGTMLLPDSPLLRFRLSLALFDASQVGKACEVALAGLEKFSGAREFLLLRARCEAAQGAVASSVATLREVLRAGLEPAPYVDEAPEFRIVRASSAYARMRSEEGPPKKTAVVR